MKTAVSIPDDVFEEAERLASELKTSRSHLYSSALREYVARHGSDAITEAMNRVVAEIGDRGADSFTAQASRRAIERSEW